MGGEQFELVTASARRVRLQRRAAHFQISQKRNEDVGFERRDQDHVLNGDGPLLYRRPQDEHPAGRSDEFVLLSSGCSIRT